MKYSSEVTILKDKTRKIEYSSDCETHQDEFAMTQQEISDEVDRIVATPKEKRVWEVDFLRGFMILFVVWDHFMWDIGRLWPYKTALFQWLYTLSGLYYKSALRKATHDVFVTMFVFTSGVSCSFSRNNGKRALKMIAFSLLFTAATYAASAALNIKVTIYFNVIHVIALSVLLWSVIDWFRAKCTKNWQKNIFGVVMTVVTVVALVVGACADVSPWTNDNSMWYFLAQHANTDGYNKFTGADYLPFLPVFGWFLVGAFLGSFLYKEKKSLFPTVNEKWVSPITFCGKYSIWVYFGSQIAMFGLIYLFTRILGWL